MSSLAAARADGYYHPPDWDPSKESRNKYHNSHGALGDRARKLDQGILIIRFEMPFNVWCAGCSHLIGKGVRFNAEKKQVGAYHSTKIWSFSMRAPCCQQRIEVQTDPRAGEYVVVSGGRRKAEPAGGEGDGRVELDPQGRAAALADPLARLEHAGEDARVARDAHAELAELREGSAARSRDDYAANRALRRQMRGARREEQALDARRAELGLPEGVALARETAADRLRASAVAFGAGTEGWKHDRRRAMSGSIFSAAAVAAATGGKRSAAGGGGAAGAGAGVLHKKRRLDAAVKLRLTSPESRAV
jgi:coiled-coil domain-containing protein 130